MAVPDAGALRAMARNGDHAALEAAFIGAEADFESGAASADDLRGMVEALIVSDPEIRAAMADWLAAEPASPHAAAIVASIRFSQSFDVRGELPVGQTWPAAIREFNALQSEGAALALAAYRAAPRFVPAADAVMAFQATERPLDPILFDAVVASVMTATPNRGSLQRAAYQTLPQWGGEGVLGVARLCEAHAAKVTEVADYDVETCAIDLLSSYQFGVFGGNVTMMIAQLLMQNDNPVLDPLRLTYGTIPDPDKAQAALASYLQDDGTTDLEQARIYDANYAVPQGLPLMQPVVGARLLARVQDRLRDDPYNRDLILRLFEVESMDQMAPPLLSPDEMLALSRDLVIAAPYDAEAWIRLTQALREAGRGDDPAMLSAQITAVAYSMHEPGPLANLRGDRLRAAERLAEDGFPGVSEDAALDGLELTLCPLIRADRLLAEACARPDAWDWMCGENGGEGDRVTRMAGLIASRGWCAWERSAPLSDIAFLPVPVDLTALVP